jgi:hypothetical protein
VTISLVMSVRPSVRPHRTTRLALDKFLKYLIYVNFSKTVEKFRAGPKSDRFGGYFKESQTYIYINISMSSSQKKSSRANL